MCQGYWVPISPGTVEARLKATGVGSALCAGEVCCRGRDRGIGISEFKSQFGVGNRPEEDPEVT